MKLATKLWTALGLVSVIAPALFSQDIPHEPNPLPPWCDTPGPQLVAWSELQKPQPVRPQFEQREPSNPHAGPTTIPSAEPAQSPDLATRPTDKSKSRYKSDS